MYRNLIAVALVLAGVQQAHSQLCARVGLQVEQSAVISRSAFRATFTLANGSAEPLIGVNVAIDIRDPEGNPANNRFGIAAPDLTGIADISGAGSVGPGGNVSARWLIVPNDLAAPAAPLIYSFGGTLTYIAGGSTLTFPFEPARLTVYPNPKLRVKYFWEKYVYSDDPFTPTFEPSLPFSIGLMMTNVGAGTASNVRITSAQPKIVWNDRDLVINFQLLGTEVAGGAATPSLTAALGNVSPGQTQVARWLMTSSLQGRFIDYAVRYQHVDDLGGIVSTLIDGEPQIFELMHVVKSQEPGADAVPDFLTNQIHAPADANENPADPAIADLPDTVHFSDGNVAHVGSELNASAALTGPLAATVSAGPGSGWRYIVVDDPGGGALRVDSITRSDGKPIAIGFNAWQTDRIFRPSGFTVLNRPRLHIFDFAGTGEYQLTYTATATLPPYAPQLAAPRVTTITIANLGTRTPADLQHAVQEETSGQFVGADHRLQPVPFWQSRDAWTNWLVRGLVPATQYAFRSKAVSDLGESAFGPSAMESTLPIVLGDLDCTGTFTCFDIDPFVLAILDPGAYAIVFPDCLILNGDMNQDGAMNNFDIDGFVDRLVNP